MPTRAAVSLDEGVDEAAFLSLIDIAVACATDATVAHIDTLHAPLSALLSRVCRAHGSDVVAPRPFGLQSVTLFRSLDAVLRAFLYFCRKRQFATRLLRWAESAGRQREMESRKKVRGAQFAAAPVCARACVCVLL
jgi:hypothetical protein